VEQSRLKINNKEVGLRNLGNGLFEPKNFSILKDVVNNDEKFEKNPPELWKRINLPLEEPEQYHKIESFCFVATENIKEEAELLLRSLRNFHDQPVYVICDKETRIHLVRQKLSKDVTFRTCAEQEHLDKINEKVFKNHSCIANNIHNPSAIFKKMDVMDFALEHHSNTFFLDADIIVLDSLQEYFQAPVVLSPHYYTRGKEHKGFEFGFYNAGYLFCASKGFPRFWKHTYLTDSIFFEQECMNRIFEHYNIQTFSEDHNVGFWRGDKLPQKAKSVHAHITSGVDKNRNQDIIDKNTEIKNYALEQAKDKPLINSFIRKYYNPSTANKVAFVHFGKCGGSYMKAYMGKNFLKPLKYTIFDSWFMAGKERSLGRDWTEEELINFFNSGDERVFVHNHHFSWSKKTIRYANDKGFLTFMFVRNPKDVLCSLYWWAKDRIAAGKQNPLHDPDGKEFQQAEGFDSAFSSKVLDISLDEFVRTFIDIKNKEGAGKLWNLPDFVDDIEYVAELNEKNISYFFNKYFGHFYQPMPRLNTSQNKGYKYYLNNGDISEETNKLIDNHPEYIKYSKYMNIKTINV